MPASSPRRAPRLGPEERIAPYVTRVGRFRRVDPLRAPSLPKPSRVIAVLGWALLLGESMRRARASVGPGGG